MDASTCTCNLEADGSKHIANAFQVLDNTISWFRRRCERVSGFFLIRVHWSKKKLPTFRLPKFSSCPFCKLHLKNEWHRPRWEHLTSLSIFFWIPVCITTVCVPWKWMTSELANFIIQLHKLCHCLRFVFMQAEIKFWCFQLSARPASENRHAVIGCSKG